MRDKNHLQVEKPLPAYQQIENHIRAQIADGSLPVGSRLPTSDALARSMGTSVFTIQRALGRLCQDGLLDRKSKVGTFVRDTRKSLTTAGIYLGHDFQSDEHASYQRLLYRLVIERLVQRDIKMQHWTDFRPPWEQTDLPPVMKQAVNRGEVQAVFVFKGGDSPIKQWASQVTLPAVYPTGNGGAVKACVHPDMAQMLQAGLQSLKEQGCRTVGLISTLETPYPNAASSDMRVGFYRRFIDTLKELGMETRNEWMRVAQKYEPQHMQFGYQQAQSLSSLSELPDGLFVFSDTAAMGVVTALLARGIAVPSRMKLALHVNEGITYPCPFAVTQMVNRVGIIADNLIEMIEKQLRGEPFDTVHIPYEIRHNPGDFSV